MDWFKKPLSQITCYTMSPKNICLAKIVITFIITLSIFIYDLSLPQKTITIWRTRRNSLNVLRIISKVHNLRLKSNVKVNRINRTII